MIVVLFAKRKTLWNILFNILIQVETHGIYNTFLNLDGNLLCYQYYRVIYYVSMYYDHKLDGYWNGDSREVSIHVQ